MFQLKGRVTQNGRCMSKNKKKCCVIALFLLHVVVRLTSIIFEYLMTFSYSTRVFQHNNYLNNWCTCNPQYYDPYFHQTIEDCYDIYRLRYWSNVHRAQGRLRTLSTRTVRFTRWAPHQCSMFGMAILRRHVDYEIVYGVSQRTKLTTFR